MTIEITKQGNPKPPHVYEGVCSRCGCEFRFTRADGHISDHRAETLVVIACPMRRCNSIIRKEMVDE